MFGMAVESIADQILQTLYPVDLACRELRRRHLPK